MHVTGLAWRADDNNVGDLMVRCVEQFGSDDDVEAIDRIVLQLEKENGQFSALLTGVIESSPFQERRNRNFVEAARPKVSVR